MSNTLNIKDNVLDNVSESQEIKDPEMKKLSEELRAHLDSIGAPQVPKEIEDIEKTMTFSSGKGDIEKTHEVRGIKSKYPLKKEQVPVFEKIKSLKLECDDDTIIVLIRQNWANGVQFFEDCLHHVNYVLQAGKAKIKSRIAFFRNCLGGNQFLITKQALHNMNKVKEWVDKNKFTTFKITEKYVQCTITGKEVSTNISNTEFMRVINELRQYQKSHA